MIGKARFPREVGDRVPPGEADDRRRRDQADGPRSPRTDADGQPNVCGTSASPPLLDAPFQCRLTPALSEHADPFSEAEAIKPSNDDQRRA